MLIVNKRGAIFTNLHYADTLSSGHLGRSRGCPLNRAFTVVLKARLHMRFLFHFYMQLLSLLNFATKIDLSLQCRRGFEHVRNLMQLGGDLGEN